MTWGWAGLEPQQDVTAFLSAFFIIICIKHCYIFNKCGRILKHITVTNRDHTNTVSLHILLKEMEGCSTVPFEFCPHWALLCPSSQFQYVLIQLLIKQLYPSPVNSVNFMKHHKSISFLINMCNLHGNNITSSIIPANLWNTKSGSWPSFLNENEGHNA